MVCYLCTPLLLQTTVDTVFGFVCLGFKPDDIEALGYPFESHFQALTGEAERINALMSSRAQPKKA